MKRADDVTLRGCMSMMLEAPLKYYHLLVLVDISVECYEHRFWKGTDGDPDMAEA